MRSKTFDNATSCSSENSLVIVDAVRATDARGAAGDAARCCSTRRRRRRLQALMWPDGKLSPAVIGQSAREIAERAADGRRAASWLAIAERNPRILMVEEDGVGHDASRTPARS